MSTVSNNASRSASSNDANASRPFIKVLIKNIIDNSSQVTFNIRKLTVIKKGQEKQQFTFEGIMIVQEATAQSSSLSPERTFMQMSLHHLHLRRVSFNKIGFKLFPLGHIVYLASLSS